MYATFNGRFVKIFRATGILERTIPVQADVVQATVSGDTVCVVCSNGYTYLYKITGTLIRTIHN